MQISYGCHSWKGHDVSEFQLRQPLTIISNYIQTIYEQNKKTTRTGVSERRPPTLLQVVKESPKHYQETVVCTSATHGANGSASLQDTRCNYYK